MLLLLAFVSYYCVATLYELRLLRHDFLRATSVLQDTKMIAAEPVTARECAT